MEAKASFSDVLVPLFTTARAFGGEVELVATGVGAQGWFLKKYARVLGALSRYAVVDLDADGEVRCYPHLIVSLRGHRDFDIDPARAPNGYDMLTFRLFVRGAYSLPVPPVALPCRSGGTKPRLMIILRGATRRFVNADAIVSAIERFGFQVVRMEPKFTAGMDAVSREVDACDVLVGAHGAGLTNIVFLRTGRWSPTARGSSAPRPRTWGSGTSRTASPPRRARSTTSTARTTP